ncbi:MAG: hypothetical protein IT379_24200 [Deltaproteobacteria bacterium]|nr:hypothetical protein [Deltaproteobacteria bacterium]
MAATKKTSGKARAAKPKTIARKDLQAATTAAVRAVLGKGFPPKPGVVAGFWLPDKVLDGIDRKPEAIAADVARNVQGLSGVRVRPEVVRAGGGILVGYIQPRIRPEL